MGKNVEIPNFCIGLGGITRWGYKTKNLQEKLGLKFLGLKNLASELKSLLL